MAAPEVIMMAGPCAIESEEQLRSIAQQLSKAKVKVLRGSAFKPRTSPYSFQGMGVEGLRLHKMLQEEHGMLIETEVMDVRDVEIVAEHVDIVRIGARNMQNFNLLKEVGRCGKPVILKRGISATVEEWLMSAGIPDGPLAISQSHFMQSAGSALFENSTRSIARFEQRRCRSSKMTHLPIIVDPSHAAGRKDIIPALSKASVAIGADGLLIEVHHLPADAKCDGKQALLPSELETLSQELDAIARAMGRSLWSSLESLRHKIDHLNAEIIGLFSERLKIAKEIAKIKKERNLPVHDPAREQEQLQVLRDLAKLHGLSPAVIEEIFTLFVDYSKINMKMEIGQ